ncbi:hypothetical protein BDW02DRAFT_572648 [Decorospora gaudefroyi]|uniref:Uncharacterized protein n=1 Tax=Decorospora gaudefroyi TaxID=184978 RepID=A0A6A5K375_9PLEO|nr:hypothetical protein BDW02DRAFT_572648 [Decorospora gaudefroyi]
MTLVNRRLHSLLAPHLFQTLVINAPLKSLDLDSLTRFHAHTLKVNMFGSLWWWCAGVYVASCDAVDLFHFLRRFTGLRCLEVSMLGRSVDLFEAAFTHASSSNKKNKEEEEEEEDMFLLPRVNRLMVSSAGAFLVRHCPALETLMVRDEKDCVVEAYTELASRFSPQRLGYPGFDFRHEALASLDAVAIWSVEEVHFVTSTFPHLRRLVMRCETYCYRASVARLTRILGAELKQLRSLRLSPIENLDMGFRSVWKRAVQACKTEELRMRLWDRNERARVEAENGVARLAFGDVDGLVELGLGEMRVARRLPLLLDGYGAKEQQEERIPRWMWQRKAELLDDCFAGTVWAKYRAERDAVVIGSEVGY